MNTPMILIFDLDDTLYSEETFAISGFKAVADYVSVTYRIPTNDSLVVMLNALEQGERGSAFQNLIIAKKLPKKSLKYLIAVYRRHQPQIELDRSAAKVLVNFSEIPKYVVTDGNKIVQRNKIIALKLDQMLERSFITHAFGLKASKPSIHCFQRIKEMEGVDWTEMVYVGDDPGKDFVNLKPLGVTTVRVLTGKHAKVLASEDFNAEFQISSMDELGKVLESRYGVQPNSN